MQSNGDFDSCGRFTKRPSSKHCYSHLMRECLIEINCKLDIGVRDFVTW